MKRTRGRISIPIAAGAAMILAFLAVFVAAQNPPPPPGRPGPRAARAQAIADLGLTPDQVQALGEFRKARMNERMAFREEMGRLRGEMRAYAGDPEANQAKIDKLIDQRAKLRAEREKGALRARAERDKIFTPEQPVRGGLATRPADACRSFGPFGRAGPAVGGRGGGAVGTAAGTAGRAP
jgi:Spy/CpxP family protein refolding chaperone